MAEHRTLSQAVRRLLFGMAMLLITSPAAQARPVTLVCNNDTRPDLGQITVDLDEAAATATLNFPARMIPNGRYPPISSPASSVGPLPARFDAKSVTFDQQKAVTDTITVYNHYTVDRVTAVLLSYFSQSAPWDQAAPKDRAMYHYTCHIGTAQF